MKLYKRKHFEDEYTCELTEELDSLAKLSESKHYEHFFHYIYADDDVRKKGCLAIRVPGGTVGGIWIDEEGVITKIKIDTDYVVKTYPNNVNELIGKFIGTKMEW